MAVQITNGNGISNSNGQDCRRPVRIANCSGAASDRGFQMYRQATAGPIDAVTGNVL